MSDGLLLDTCAIIWLMEAEPLSAQSRVSIANAAKASRLHVSVFTAWEVALLHARNRRTFSADPRAWFALVGNVPGLSVLPVTETVLIESIRLPGRLHNDPADRILIATARELDMVLVTRDQPILDYGAGGNVRVMLC